MVVGIDASTIRSGGGVAHLAGMLTVAQPMLQGIDRVVVWGGATLLNRLPSRPWLEVIHDSVFDASLIKRMIWHATKLDDFIPSHCDLIFSPAGTYSGSFRPFVSLSQNMLPFEPPELRRYGLSFAALRLIGVRVAQSRSFHKTSGMIFLSKYAQHSIQQTLSKMNAPSVVIPHGVNDAFRLEPRPQKPITQFTSKKPFRFLYVSPIDMYKHQWHVAQAMSFVRKYNLPIELELIGPPYHPALKRYEKALAKLQLGEDVIRYIGAVPFEELPAYYHRADAFLFASSCENLPITLLEAMAAGLPIACSKKGPMPEALGDAGVYFDPECAEDIADAMIQIVNSVSLRETCAEKAYKKAKEFTWEQCSEETFRFFSQVLAS